MSRNNILDSKGIEEKSEQSTMEIDKITLFLCRQTTIIFLRIYYRSLNNNSHEYEWTEIERKTV